VGVVRPHFWQTSPAGLRPRKLRTFTAPRLHLSNKTRRETLNGEAVDLLAARPRVTMVDLLRDFIYDDDWRRRKRWFMNDFGLFAALAIPLAFLTLLIIWTATDAVNRGKSPLLVCLLVVLTFPFGLLAWIVFRPQTETPNKRRFNLQDYRSN
jgi:hypothetical protein